jgi:TRAP-type C4-dicarboxylate transport system permease small subunit
LQGSPVPGAGAPPGPRAWAARALAGLHAIERALAVAALLGTAAALVADLIGRELFGQGLFGAQRLAVHLTFAAGMLGFVVATAQGAHLRVKATDRLLPLSWSAPLTRAGQAVSALLLAALAWYALRFVLQTQRVGERSVTLAIPLWPVQALLVYAFASAALRYTLAACVPALAPPERAEEDAARQALVEPHAEAGASVPTHPN